MIRKAKREDMPRLIEIYDYARAFMASVGNASQWGDGYPLPSQLEEDIALGRLYVACDENGIPHGAFAFILGDDPTAPSTVWRGTVRFLDYLRPVWTSA